MSTACSELCITFDPFDEGTFLFPPEKYPDAAAYLQFWNTTPISDGILANICAARAELMRKRSVAAGVAWGRWYDGVNEAELHHKNPSREAIADAARAVAYDAYMVEWWGDIPHKIAATAARRIVRAGQMYWYQNSIYEEDRVDVLKTTIRLSDSDLTPEEVCARYQLNEIRTSFCETTVTVAERLEDVRLELQHIRGQLPRQ
ncbi:hypothetical protein [Cryobacterium luteum]|uniref:Uncharacterized protein n=1 Tax=Cryobacterium luteum TaxID=1424661 RepID=A0A1H8LWN2_9MICO|nr:hypothetical protein [Cryobacterium luteum]TFB86184.1 hypothetical protein E3O10_14415 [Cryobacterium luteum]SEO09495.1 hypothetical protein SAMN05216281_1333 [Cryobacterium luteum]